MEKTRLSSKGQVIIPKSVREAHGWESGTEFYVEDTGIGITLRPVKSQPAATLDELIGCVGYVGPRVSIAEMDQSITAEARRLSATRGSRKRQP
jgi:AbrB family looped-hinge helix DNA binding protein